MTSELRPISFLKTIDECNLLKGVLRIPRTFVSEHWEGISNPVILVLPDGTTWEVTWEKLGLLDVIMLGDQWKEFVQFYSLDVEYSLKFSFKHDSHDDGRSQFQVVIYDQTGMEIDYPSLLEITTEFDEESDQSGECVDQDARA